MYFYDLPVSCQPSTFTNIKIYNPTYNPPNIFSKPISLSSRMLNNITF